MKKIISIALALVMVLSLMPTAWADEPEPVARIDTATYTSLAAAVSEAGTGSIGTEITLMQDTSVSNMIEFTKNITLNLNGHKLNSENAIDSWAQVTDSKTLTIIGNTEGSAAYGRINLGKAGNNNGSLVINGGTYAVGNDQTVIHINGECLSSDVTITDATITSANDNAIQLNGKGTFNISNSTFTGGTGIYIKAGNLTLSNTAVTGNLDPVNYSYNGNGANPTGDGIVVDACEYPGGDPTVTINSDCSICGSKNAVGYYQYDVNKDGKTGTATIDVKGGKFSDLSAVQYAEYGATITMLQDVTGNVTIPAGKAITLDLNGKTLSANGKTTTILNNGTLTLKGGTVTSTDHAGIAVGSNSKTTIESNVTVNSVEGAVITGTATGATVTINGGTFSASDNAVIAGNGTGREGDANTITINDGTFNGNIVSNGYIACGIYAPWKDIITVNGGTFNVTNGIGIVARAGQVTVNGGTFNCTGTTSGWVGDNKNMIPCGAVVFDAAANYPAKDADSKILLTGGTFSSNPIDYVAKGYAVVSKDGTKFVVSEAKDTAAVAATANTNNEKVAVTVSNITAADNATTNTIDVSSFDDTTKPTKEVSVTRDELAKVVKTDAAKPVEFKMAANTSVKFNVEAVKAIATNMGIATENVTLTVTPQATVTGNEATANSKVANANTQVVTLELKQGDTKLFTGTAGEAEVTVPFTMPSNCNTVSVYYLKNDGTAKYVGTANTADGTATFAVKHFSSYALVPTYVGGGSYTPTAAQTITTDLTAGSITRVTVDGKVVDSKNYTVSGSNVTLSDAYMKTLSNGKHTVAIENATKVAKATITVNNTTTATTAKPVTASKTGDAGIALYAGMAVASLLGTGVVITSRKRKVR